MQGLVMQFLGTGAGEGIPTPFCRCKVCENARKVKGKEIRMRSCFRVSESLMIDMGPDVFSSCARQGIDLFDLEHLLVTHSDEDHFNIFNLFLKHMISRASGKKLHVYLTGDTFHIIEAYDNAGFEGREKFFTTELGGDIAFHKLKFWKNHQIGDYEVIPVKGAHTGRFEKNSANYLIGLPNGMRMLYGLDTGYYPEETFEFLKNKTIDIFIVESTYGSADRGNTPYSHLDLKSAGYLAGALYNQGTLTKKTKVFLTHINQEQDFTHEQMAAYCTGLNEPYEITVAYDGMKISI